MDNYYTRLARGEDISTKFVEINLEEVQNREYLYCGCGMEAEFIYDDNNWYFYDEANETSVKYIRYFRSLEAVANNDWTRVICERCKEYIDER